MNNTASHAWHTWNDTRHYNGVTDFRLMGESYHVGKSILSRQMCFKTRIQ